MHLPVIEEFPVHSAGNGIVIAVCDSASVAEIEIIKDVVHVPLGMLEFERDSAMEALFDYVFKEKDAVLYLVCGAGGQVAIARKTLKDMSFTYVVEFTMHCGCQSIIQLI